MWPAGYFSGLWWWHDPCGLQVTVEACGGGGMILWPQVLHRQRGMWWWWHDPCGLQVTVQSGIWWWWHDPCGLQVTVQRGMWWWWHDPCGLQVTVQRQRGMWWWHDPCGLQVIVQSGMWWWWHDPCGLQVTVQRVISDIQECQPMPQWRSGPAHLLPPICAKSHPSAECGCYMAQKENMLGFR